jgi:uncharacterized protein
MAISLGEREEFILNHYRSRKIKDGHLVTNDWGSWAYLDDIEYGAFRRGAVDNSLFSLLKERGIALNRKNIGEAILAYRRKCSYLFQGTSLHIVVPTLRCNIRCIYCHAKARPVASEGFDMDEVTAQKTVDFIFQSPSSAYTIEFQGGEPLLRFDIIKYIIDRCLEKNKIFKKSMHFSVVTNMTNMTDEIFKYFKDRNVGICTSIDGPEIVHNANRQEYKKVRDWTEKILKTYTLNAMMLTTRHSLNYPKEIVDEYFGLGLPRIWVKPANRLAFADDNWNNIGFTAEEYLKYWSQVIDYIIEKNKERQFVENYTRILLKKILTKDCVNFTDLESPCGAAIAQLAYNFNGNIHACDEGRLYDVFKIGTVDDKYSDVLSSQGACSIVRASLNDNPVCEVCAYKPYCGLCPVCSYSETQNIITKLPDRRCKILIGMFDSIFEKLLHDANAREVFYSWIGIAPKGHENI